MEGRLLATQDVDHLDIELDCCPTRLKRHIWDRDVYAVQPATQNSHLPQCARLWRFWRCRRGRRWGRPEWYAELFEENLDASVLLHLCFAKGRCKDAVGCTETMRSRIRFDPRNDRSTTFLLDHAEQHLFVVLSPVPAHFHFGLLSSGTGGRPHGLVGMAVDLEADDAVLGLDGSSRCDAPTWCSSASTSLSLVSPAGRARPAPLVNANSGKPSITKSGGVILGSGSNMNPLKRLAKPSFSTDTTQHSSLN